MSQKINGKIKKYKKNPNKAELNQLINLFNPLINKYSNKTNLNFREDFKQELKLELFILITKIANENIEFKEDKYLLNYIKKTMFNKYLFLLKKYKNFESEIMSNEQNISNIPYEKDFNVNLSFDEIIKILNEKEKMIIINHYKYDIKISKIAEKTNLSRQNINQIKLRALDKLKNKLEY